MKRCSWIMLSTCLYVGLWVVSVSAWYPHDERYEQWQAKRPLMYGAWHRCEPSDHIPDRMARFQAIGLNTLFWQKPWNAVPYFEEASRLGLQWQSSMTKSTPWTPSTPGNQVLLDMIATIPGCAAIQVVDEPSTDGLSPSEKRDLYREIRSRIEWVHESIPDTLAFASLSLLSIDPDEYVRECHPDVFSYDMYPLLRNGETDEDYLYHLKNARDTAIRHRLPFWMILQSFGRDLDDAVAYRIPSESDTRFLAFTLLAHGGIGMQFFMYEGTPESMIQVPELSPTQEWIKQGDPIAYEQTHPSRSFYAVRDMANEIQTLGRVLLQLRPTRIIGYTGAVPKDVPAFEGHRGLRTVEGTDETDTTLLVAFFDDQHGEEYFMVVNCEHGEGMDKVDAARWVTLRFNGNVDKIERLNRLTGRIETLDTTVDRDGRSLNVYLPGGTGDLFKWHNENSWKIRPPATEDRQDSLTSR